MPPFGLMAGNMPQTVTFTVYLDREKPLSEPKWVRTGDIDEWLRGIYGHLKTHSEDGRALWTGRIEVVDPDPVSTAYHFRTGIVYSSLPIHSLQQFTLSSSPGLLILLSV